MSEFKYTPLSTTNQIRLLCLVGWDEDEQLLKCSLEHIRLDKLRGDPDDVSPTTTPSPRPGYAAISYCRGSPEKPRVIDIDGRQLAVCENAWKCLVQLYRHQVDARGGTTTITTTTTNAAGLQGHLSNLWIDAVCINWDDITERNSQVAIMADIFSSAWLVYSWLGPSTLPDSAASEDAMRFFAELLSPNDSPLSPGALVSAGADDSPETTEEASVESSLLPSDIPRDQLDDALYDFFTRPYWSCIWTVQELILASNIEVIWGTQRAHWRSVEFLLTDSAAQRDFQTLHQRLSNVDAVKLAQMKRSYFPRSSTLTSLITSFRSFHAPDPRDKVFALLGLASDPVSVDYALALEALWHQLVLHSLGEWSRVSHAHVNGEAEALAQALGVEMTDEQQRWVLLELVAYLKQFETKMLSENPPWWGLAPGDGEGVPECVPKVEGLGARYWDWGIVVRLDEEWKKYENGRQELVVDEGDRQDEGLEGDDEDEVETVVQSPLQHLIESQPKDIDDTVKPNTEAVHEPDWDSGIDAAGHSGGTTPRALPQGPTGDIPSLIDLDPRPLDLSLEMVEEIETPEPRGRRWEPRTWEYSKLIDRLVSTSRSSSPDSELAYQDDDDWDLGDKCYIM